MREEKRWLRHDKIILSFFIWMLNAAQFCNIIFKHLINSKYVINIQ